MYLTSSTVFPPFSAAGPVGIWLGLGPGSGEWEPCEVSQKGDMLQWWNRLTNIPANSLTKQIF